MQLSHLSPKIMAFSMTVGDRRMEGSHLGLERRDAGLKLGHRGVMNLRTRFPGVTAERQFSQSLFEGFKLLATGDRFGFPLA